ncbi:hypothetical protein [Aquabacterium sp.]|uniref:hypothetical protein n=1 Tax=Aquabacterium sp. TaxID=1872578 RepID=UPI0024882F3C|nr:hypothetical protein [Aquabacterium sp.]MDI1260439.1 hypothetical protein [Aquabacterium sp.]
MHHDLIPVLTEDIDVLRDLVNKVQSTRDFRHKQELTNDLYLSLNGHMAIVEKTVLPMLRTFTGASLPDTFSVHYEEIRSLLSDLMARRVELVGLDAALEVLCATLNLQNERERLFLLPAVERALDTDERAYLALASCHQLSREMRKGMVNLPAALMPSMT